MLRLLSSTIIPLLQWDVDEHKLGLIKKSLDGHLENELYFALRTLRFLDIHFPKVTECGIWDSGFYLME